MIYEVRTYTTCSTGRPSAKRWPKTPRASSSLAVRTWSWRRSLRS
jgi:hypothetical protein